MLNHIDIMGRFVRDPEMHQTKSGKELATFTLAVDRDRTNPDGSRTADFIDCKAFAGAANFVSKYFSKGSMAVVSGRLEINTWTDKDGSGRRKAEILVSSIYFGEGKKSDSDKADKPKYQSQTPGYKPQQSSYGYGAFSDYEDDEDCPF